jgi:thermostable 8-oxoguanine DNA glycosylase
MPHSAEQSAWGFDGQSLIQITLPAPNQQVMQGVQWGKAEELFTPAFWKYQALLQRARHRYTEHRIGTSLLDEVSVCLLGGYGLPAELGLAAFDRLKNAGMLDGYASAKQLEAELSVPFDMSGRPRRYRFPRQKSRYLAAALIAVRELPEPTCGLTLRTFLMGLDGIGPKTASWIVRNYLASNEVAILDVHVIRAGAEAGIFDQAADPARDYFGLEARFLSFCVALDEPASQLDAMMWDFMRRVGPTARKSKSSHTTRAALSN